MRAPQRVLTLAALLALRTPGTPNRESLASALWPEVDDETARANLRRHLHLLAQALPEVAGVPWLLRDRLGVGWNPQAPFWSDVEAFQTSIADPHRRVEAIALYRGPLLEGSSEFALIAHRERLQQLCVDACREEALAARSRLDYGAAIQCAERILSLDEWREDALRLAMSLRYESGDRASALAVFERFATHLRDEMGIDPMPETLALRDGILMNAATPSLSAPAAPTQERVAPGTPFVGRAQEFELLQSAWREAVHGRGSTIFVSGEAGIGKSRLTAEFATWVQLQGGRVLFGETSNPERHFYEPFVDALRRGLALVLESPVDQPWLSIVAELVPELHAALPDLPSSESVEPATARTRLLEALARTIEHLSRARPLLLVLEDVHWSQTATLDAIERLARRIGGVGALVVATYRTGEGASELLARRRAMQAEGRATALELARLGAGDIGALVGPVAGAHDERELAQTIYDASEGLPLFAAQLLRGFVETGQVPDASRMAATLGQTIRARVDGLDAPSLALAQVASAMGGSFSIDVLAGVLGWTEGAVLDAIDPLLDRALVRPVGSSAFAFTFAHALIAATVYETIDAKQRSLRHRRIAAVLTALAGSDPLALASIARHWQEGGEPERAGRTYAQAARAAFAAYAPDESIALAGRALETSIAPTVRYEMCAQIAAAQRLFRQHASWHANLQALTEAAAPLGDAERFNALQEWAEYYGHRAELVPEDETTQQMIELARRLEPPDRCTALVARAAFHEHRGEDADAIRLLDEALAIAMSIGNVPMEADIRRRLSRIAARVGTEAEALQYLEKLSALIPSDSPPPLLAQRLLAEGHIAIHLQDAVAAGRAGRAMIELGDRIGDRLLSANGVNVLAFASQWLANVAGIRASFEATIERCTELGFNRGFVISQSNAAYVELEIGFAGRALEIADRHLPAAIAMGDQSIVSKFHKVRAAALELLGERCAAIEAARTAVAQTGNDRRTWCEGMMTLATIEVAAGDSQNGLRHGFEALAAAREMGPRGFAVEALSQYLVLLLDCERPVEAASIAGELHDMGEPEAIAGIWHLSRVHYALGRAAEATGQAVLARAEYALGRAALERQLDRLGDEARAGIEALPFNRRLLQACMEHADRTG